MARDPVWPLLRQAPLTAGGCVWQVTLSDDLASALIAQGSAPPSLNAGAIEALAEALVLPGSDPWRLSVDMDGLLLGMAVHPNAGSVHLGSPRFATELLLLATLPAPPAEWAAHAGSWQAAATGAAPLDIDRSTTSLGLPDDALADAELLDRVRDHANQLARHMGRYRPGLWERVNQLGLALQADFAVLRVHVLRFVALLPSLDHDVEGVEVRRLLVEMLRRMVTDSERARASGKVGLFGPLPVLLESCCRVAGLVARTLPARWVSTLTRVGVRRMARSFIAGEDIVEAQPALLRLKASGRSATLDQLGELVVREAEADRYCGRVVELVRGCGEVGQAAELNDAGIPLGHVSVKVSALCAHYDPDDIDGTWRRVGPRLLRICSEARQRAVFINLDAEHYAVRDLTFHMFERLAGPGRGFGDYPWLGIVVQAYLRDGGEHLEDLLEFCRRRAVRVPIRLVKGAYWDEEGTHAMANGYDAPQFLNKAETDVLFQQLCLRILAEGDVAQLCVGSHNLRDHCFARAARELRHPEAPVIEHQTLHATYEALSTAMSTAGWPTRNYVPVGSLLVGMAYLVRRIMENSSQVGVLTMARHGVNLHTALVPPAAHLASAEQLARHHGAGVDQADVPPFENVAPVRLYRPRHRRAFEAAIHRRTLAKGAGQVAEGPYRTGDVASSRSPSDESVVVGEIRFAQSEDVSVAVAAAEAAWPAWAESGPAVRAAILSRTAERMRARRLDLAVLVALEGGKSRDEALADVDESIDFLQFYGREALRIEGEAGDGTLEARGVIAVVAPWNFPLAIPCGMTVAALAAGNAAILKSARPTPLIAQALVDLLHESGVPQDVLIHLPGQGSRIGAPLLADHRVAGCVFTGSVGVGSGIHEQLSGRTVAGRAPLVITEMGGKNAVIVTANADLDEAISGCVYGAFGHAGQKCSAASRLLVDQRIVEPFIERLVGAAADWHVGDALSPGTQINPVINGAQADRLRQVAALCRAECELQGGRVLLDHSATYRGDPGHRVGPAIFLLPAESAALPQSQAQAEHFGPILHVIPYADLDQALALFNGTEFALTGGLFTQSLDEVDRFVEQMACGNIYVNRSNTGARVAIEPFGGFKMSGTGPKAGGERYVRAFYQTAKAPIRTWDQVPGQSIASRIEADVSAAVQGLRALWSARPITRRIPGQNSHYRWDLARGRLCVLASDSEVSPEALHHIIAALVAGNPVQVGLLPAARTWRPALQALRGYGSLATGLEESELGDDITAVQWLRDRQASTVVLDRPRARCSELLANALEGGPTGDHVWALYGVGDGPLAGDWQGLLRCHLHVRTVAINTMRHGAPLSLDASV